MKKTLSLLSLLLCLQFLTARAQQNLYVWKNGSYIVIINTAEVDSITFSTQSDVTVVNGHEYVDLGLPSGLRWATCNVGAITPYEDGDYFAWGEVEPKTYYDWGTYKWYNVSNYTKYTKNGKTTLDAEDDAATQNWGEGWRMPTIDEFKELLANTTNEWTEMSGVYGRKFTSKKNSAFVFFPASGLRYYGYLIGHGSGGLYWSGSLYPSRDDGACSLYFGSGGCVWGSYDRSYGHAVRAVCPYPGLSASIAQE